MLLALGLSSFDTVIHNYRKSFLYVWSEHSGETSSMCESVCISMTFTAFYCTFLLILSVCMSVCVCVWAMLPDSNKIMMVMINFHNQQFSSQKIMKSKTREWVLSVHRLSAPQQCSKTGSLCCNACCTRPMTGHHTMPCLSAALRPTGPDAAAVASRRLN